MDRIGINIYPSMVIALLRLEVFFFYLVVAFFVCDSRYYLRVFTPIYNNRNNSNSSVSAPKKRGYDTTAVVLYCTVL